MVFGKRKCRKTAPFLGDEIGMRQNQRSNSKAAPSVARMLEDVSTNFDPTALRRGFVQTFQNFPAFVLVKAISK